MYKKWRCNTLQSNAAMYFFIGDFLQDVKRKGFNRFDWYRIAGFNDEQFFRYLSTYVSMTNIPARGVTVNGEEDTLKASMVVVDTYEKSFNASKWWAPAGSSLGIFPKQTFELKGSFSERESLYAKGINPVAKVPVFESSDESAKIIKE